MKNDIGRNAMQFYLRKVTTFCRCPVKKYEEYDENSIVQAYFKRIEENEA